MLIDERLQLLEFLFAQLHRELFAAVEAFQLEVGDGADGVEMFDPGGPGSAPRTCKSRSIRVGVRTARDTAAQSVWRFVA